ncbi:MAG TPA: hypothetical protein VFM41_07710 [Gaiella sp.]|jgi:hypothetical protein|nr:hypothetical protein [Gaiella sp.]
MNVDGSPVGWVAIDFLSCLLLVVYTLVAPPPMPASIDTSGQYAVEVTWPASRDDDVDTYVQDPAGNVVSFSNSDVGLMHLEHDDLGRSSDVERHGGDVAVVRQNLERVVLRGVLPGEVTVNVHAYRKTTPGPCPVKVVLWRLRGNDKRLLERRLELRETGQELTAFRFTLDRRGELRDHNELPKRFVGRSA